MAWVVSDGALGTRVGGGERGIRTLDRVSPIHAFQACAFNHSAISPGSLEADRRGRKWPRQFSLALHAVALGAGEQFLGPRQSFRLGILAGIGHNACERGAG